MVEYIPSNAESVPFQGELQEELAGLQKEIEAERINRNKIKTLKELDFGYETSDISQIKEKILKVAENFDNDSLEYILLNNPQIQNLIYNIIEDQKTGWGKDYEKYKLKKTKDVTEEFNEELYEEAEGGFEKWEDYHMRESTSENFEQYLLSEEGITELMRQINYYIDGNGNITSNYKILKKDLEVNLKIAWLNSMHNDYNNITFSEMFENKTSWGDFINSINGIIRENFSGAGNRNEKSLINKLEQLINDNEGTLLNPNIESIDKDNLQVILRDMIKEYAKLIINKDKTQLSTGVDILDLKLKSYLYIYGRIFHSSIFNVNGGDFNECGGELKEILDAIISFDGDVEKLRRNKYLDAERKSEEERCERDRKRRHEAYMENIKKNGRKLKTKHKGGSIEKQNEIIRNLDEATGEQIARDKGLSKELGNYKVKIDETKVSDMRLREHAFNTARNEFTEQYDYLRGIITEKEMHNIFDVKNGVIDPHNLEVFNDSAPIFKGVKKENINQINSILQRFKHNFDKELEKHINFSTRRQAITNEEIKDKALGNVIDYIRDIFSIIIERQQGNIGGLKLDNIEPVKVDGDDLIMSGFFNGSDIKIRYNLKSGEIFTNSFFHKPDELGEPPITIGYGLEIDHKIGTIKSFYNILNEESATPKHIEKQRGTTGHMKPKLRAGISKINSNLSKETEEILNSISEELILGTWSQTEKRRAIIGLLKTFNIMRDGFPTDKIIFNKSSNLYKIITVLNNSDCPDLTYFNNVFMPIVMKYSGLKWGENNLSQDKQNKDSRKIYGETNENNKFRKLLKDKTENFNPTQFAGVKEFKETNNLDFADLIKENIIGDYDFKNGETLNELNLKLNRKKMSDFLRALENENNNKI